MEPLDTIRQNLIAAGGYAKQIFPCPPPQLLQEIGLAWGHYQQLQKAAEQRTALPGKTPMRKEDFGFVWFIIGGAAALAALLGGGALLTQSLNESERIKQFAKCIRDLTSQGISQAEATKQCNTRFGKQPLVSVGSGFDPMTILTVGGVGLIAFFLLGKAIK